MGPETGTGRMRRRAGQWGHAPNTQPAGGRPGGRNPGATPPPTSPDSTRPHQAGPPRAGQHLSAAPNSLGGPQASWRDSRLSSRTAPKRRPSETSLAPREAPRHTPGSSRDRVGQPSQQPHRTRPQPPTPGTDLGALPHPRVSRAQGPVAPSRASPCTSTRARERARTRGETT